MKWNFLLILIAIPSLLLAGDFGVSAKASMYDPPGDASPSLMLGVEGVYTLNSFFDATVSIEWTKYDENNQTITLIPVLLNGKFHPVGRGNFDPYVGFGAGYYYREGGLDIESTAGGKALAGISWKNKKGNGFVFEIAYSIPDFQDFSQGGLTYSGGVTGSLDFGTK